MPPDLVDHAAGLLTQDERPSAKVHGEGASGIAAPAEGPLNCASSAAVSLAFTSTSLTNGRKHLTYRTGVTHERAPERFNGLFGTTWADGGPMSPATLAAGGRQSYTVHGDAVNLAARLEALCKTHGTPLLLSAATAKALPGAELVAVGSISVRGLSEPVAVYSMAARIAAA